jgi:hypothetical protein
MKKYTFTKENHFALIKAGYQIQKEGYNSDGDVVVQYYNENNFTRMGLVRPDEESYIGIVPKWESELQAA